MEKGVRDNRDKTGRWTVAEDRRRHSDSGVEGWGRWMRTKETEKNQRFVSEPLEPVAVTIDPSGMAKGEPGLPGEFSWRGQPLRVATVLRTWRECGPCKQGSSESYVRKHWFEVETTSHQRARIYFERQARGRARTRRWWLFSIEEHGDGT